MTSLLDGSSDVGLGRRRRRPSGEPPPLPHELDRASVGWLCGFVFFSVLWVWIFLSDDPAIWITERDLELMDPIVENRRDSLTPSMQRVNQIGTHWFTPLVGWLTIGIGLVTRRTRHVVILVVSLAVVAALDSLLGNAITRPRPLGVTLIGDWEGFAQPSRPVALATVALVAGALTVAPRGWARRGWYLASALLLAVFGFAQMYVGVDHPTDILAGVTAGVAITLALFRFNAPESVFPVSYRTGKTAHLDVSGARGVAIRRGVRQQLGLTVNDLQPVGLEGSAGSTPLRLDVAEDGEDDGADDIERAVFAKLYSQNHLRSDRWYKLGRTLLYGRLEDETRYESVRRLVQHEDYMQRVMADVGIPCPRSIGIVEITPDREYLLVTEFLEGATEIGEVDVDDALIDQGLAIIRRLWDEGLAHRDIKPANLMVQDRQLSLIDCAFAQVRPSPWRQAVDLANMMLVLALRSDAETVYRRAQERFTPNEIAEAFAASKGVTIPAGLRADLKRDGRQLLEHFRALAPPRQPVPIQRWTLRRLGLTVSVSLVVVGGALAFVSSLSDIGLR